MKRTLSLIASAILAATVLLADIAPLDGHPEWGYTVSDLGANGDETAVVFTNSAETATWSVPANLSDVRFLVVGGGGGGGGGTWGPGGGGGGVVTGLVHSLTKNAVITAKVGADQSTNIEKVEMTLRAYAKGINVTAKRGAELVWSAEDNTLYYRQKPQGKTVFLVQ